MPQQTLPTFLEKQNSWVGDAKTKELDQARIFFRENPKENKLSKRKTLVAFFDQGLKIFRNETLSHSFFMTPGGRRLLAVLGVIAKGAFGKAKLCEDEAGEFWVLKRIFPGENTLESKVREMVSHELVISQKVGLSDENELVFHRIGRAKDSKGEFLPVRKFYFLQRYCGQSLRSFLKEPGARLRQRPDETMRLAISTALNLHETHEQDKVVHLDIKAENLSKDGVFFDYGLAEYGNVDKSSQECRGNLRHLPKEILWRHLSLGMSQAFRVDNPFIIANRKCSKRLLDVFALMRVFYVPDDMQVARAPGSTVDKIIWQPMSNYSPDELRRHGVRKLESRWEYSHYCFTRVSQRERAAYAAVQLFQDIHIHQHYPELVNLLDTKDATLNNIPRTAKELAAKLVVVSARLVLGDAQNKYSVENLLREVGGEESLQDSILICYALDQKASGGAPMLTRDTLGELQRFPLLQQVVAELDALGLFSQRVWLAITADALVENVVTLYESILALCQVGCLDFRQKSELIRDNWDVFIADGIWQAAVCVLDDHKLFDAQSWRLLISYPGCRIEIAGIMSEKLVDAEEKAALEGVLLNYTAQERADTFCELPGPECGLSDCSLSMSM